MAILGLDPEELHSVSVDECRQFYMKRDRSSNVNQELIDLRWKTLNKRRFDKRDLIIAERKKIIDNENMMYGGPQTSLS